MPGRCGIRPASSATTPSRSSRRCLGALAGPAAKPYQGEVVDPLLPRERRAEWIVTDPAGLSSALETELARLGVKRSHPTPLQAISATRGAFRREHLVELGIGCESCHLGAAEHVRDPSKLPSFEPRSSFFAVKWPARVHGGASELRATRINRACARCHQVVFSGYEPTWEGGTRHGNAGGSHINSGEARDMMLGACASRLSCAECHEPHAADATAKLRALVGTQQDALCTQCHDRYVVAGGSPSALASRAGRGGRRAVCRVTCRRRTSRSTERPLATTASARRTIRSACSLDRPMECALCHADKSVESLVKTTETWWKRPYDREALRKLYGSLDANVLLATAERGKPHEQAVAFYVLGEARSQGGGAGARVAAHPSLSAGARLREARARCRRGKPDPDRHRRRPSGDRGEGEGLAHDGEVVK